MKKLLSVLLALVMLLSVAAFTKTAKATVPKAVSYKVTDSRGVKVTFNKTPKRIISLLPSDTEIVYAFGLGKNLIAVSEYCNYPADTKNKKRLPSGSKINVESIISLKPDVVIMGKMSQSDAQFKQLQNAGIRVIVTDANNIADTYKVIDMLGKVLKVEKKSTDIINKMKKDFNTIKQKVKGKKAYKVYVEISPVAYGPWTCGRGTFQDELLNVVGAKNIFNDIKGWVQVSQEQVISRNPDLIFTTDAYSNADPVGEIKGRETWSGINAIKNGKVFLADGDILSRPSPRLVDAAKELAARIYGIKF